jgi:uncharacterized integral membrane protein
MKLRTLFLFVILAVISVFAAINWSAFTAETTLSLGFGAVRAPLGLVMLGITAFLAVLFAIFAVFIRTSTLLETRRCERELQAMRELADNAEGSRFTKLRELLESETQGLRDVDGESRAEVLARLAQLENALTLAIDQSGNSLAASVAELEDKVERWALLKTPTPPAGNSP